MDAPDPTFSAPLRDNGGAEWWLAPPERTGVLHKKGAHLPTWRRRVFVLRNGLLLWFRDEADAAARAASGGGSGRGPRGAFALAGFAAAREAPEVTKPFPFAIRLVAADSGGKGGGRGDVLLVAESDDDMQRWLALLSAELRVYERAAFAARYVARERDGWSVERPAWRAGWRAPPRKAMFELSVATHGNGGAGEGAAPDQKPNAQKAALQRMVLSLLRAPRRCRAPLATSEGARTALAGALAGLRHPYLLPAAHGGYDRERRRVVVVRPFCREGSLRDRLHRAARGEPLNSNYVDKYLGGVLCARAPVAAPRGLGVAEVASIGRQVLEALQYLQDRKLRGAHLHAGNVVLDRGRAMLTDVIENELLGLPVRGAGPEQGAAAGVAAFGRLLHEMATGRALEGSAPTLVSPAGMAAAKAVPPPVMTVLRLIFEAEERPPLAEVLKAPLFANQVLLADVRFINQAPLDGKPRQLIRSAGDLPIELDACESVDVEDEEDDE